MNPQSWLDAFVQRNLLDLARVRGYVEMSLATTMTTERKKRPRPGRIEGGVVAMDVRDLTLLAASNPLFESGTFKLRPRPNRGVRLVEKSTGRELALRKILESPTVQGFDRGGRQYAAQGMLFDSPEELAEGLVPALVWSIDKADLLGEFRAVVVDGIQSLDRSPLIAVATADVLPL
ncbi:MAG TPA: hypothetical protein VFP69_01290, partial [Streptomyces sp.]|nr:hypothetical protein [Streptomyces sp.]